MIRTQKSTGGDDFAGMCEDNRIIQVFLPPRASNQRQSLDLCLSGMRKKVIRLKKAENSKIQTQHIVQILDEFARAATPTNIISSFRNAGIDRLLEKMIGPGGDVICHRLCRVSPYERI